jgi:F-type H+-transporting ATPase subunit b
MITFAVFVWFCMKYIWPPIVNALAERKTKSAEGLAAAERGHHEQELGQQRATEIMKEAKSQAADIVNQANKRATEIVDEAKQDARDEGARLVTAARAEIDQEVNRAREELRGKMVVLAVSAAEKILQKEIDPTAHTSIVDSFAKQI